MRLTPSLGRGKEIITPSCQRGNRLPYLVAPQIFYHREAEKEIENAAAGNLGSSFSPMCPTWTHTRPAALRDLAASRFDKYTAETYNRI